MEQAAENGVSVEARQATPYDFAFFIYQRPYVAVSD
jgi:hypothetical protein